ncbi:MAG: sigma-70 family RNA polymerase sigma factor [Candidatus Promineifilaceae bacterium]
MLDEKNLLTSLRQRNPEAFTAVFEQHADKLFRLAVGLLHDEDEAESVVQDAFLRLITKLDSFDGRSQLGTWLYRVTYNLTMDILRQRQPSMELDEIDIMPKELTDWGQWPEKIVQQAEETAVLHQAIAALPENLRAIFLLREIEGLSTTETARIVGLTEANVKVRLHRARLFLREKLAEAFATA